MSCLKCGRDTQEDHVFCDQCQAVMEQYPVKPGIAIQLPKRQEAPVHRTQPKRRTVPMEEIIRVQRKRLWTLSILLFLSLAIIGVLMFPAYQGFFGKKYLPGQNYKTVITTPPPSSQSAASTGAAGN